MISQVLQSALQIPAGAGAGSALRSTSTVLAAATSGGGEAALGFPLLPAIILIPLIGGALILATPSRRIDAFKQIALLSSLISSALVAYLLIHFDKADAGYQFVVNHSWISDLGITFHMGVDGISLWMLVLNAIIFPIAVVCARVDENTKAYYGWLMLLQAASMGVFVALDLLLFFVFFELVLVPMYFLIGGWGHGRRIYAANKFFIYTMFGSAFMLVGVVATAVLNARSAGGPLTFDIVEITTNQAIATSSARWLFVAFAIAFAVKVPLFPVHTWLPDAHTNAPTAGSVVLAAVLLKFGVYGFIRFGLQMFPEAAHWAAPVMMTLGVIGILYGAIAATMQPDLKRLIAYTSIAHLGFAVLGVFSLSVQGLDGAILVMFNHGISTGALFILVGWIYERRHTRMIDELGGFQKVAPIFAAAFTLVLFASIGLPGLNGFPGEFLALLGAFSTARWWGIIAAIGVILAALYLLWAYQRVFHGEPTEENAKFPELRFSEGLVLAPLLILIVFIGLYPKIIVDRTEPSADKVIAQIDEHVPSYTPRKIEFNLPDAAPATDSDQGSDHEGGN